MPSLLKNLYFVYQLKFDKSPAIELSTDLVQGIFHSLVKETFGEGVVNWDIVVLSLDLQKLTVLLSVNRAYARQVRAALNMAYSIQIGEETCRVCIRTKNWSGTLLGLESPS